MTTSLKDFIAHARGKGMDAQTVRMLLLSTGWKEKDIAEALASSTLDMPVPTPPDAGSARDTFFHLLTFVSLTATVSALITLFFQYLDRLLPDAAYQNYYDDFSGIRWSVAVTLVSFPLLLWMGKLLTREYRAHPEKLGGASRRWITYLILFITACTLIGDAITLLFYLLDGELTTRFILKILTILVLCGLPFVYFLRAMRLTVETYAHSTLHRTFVWIGTGIVILAFVWGMFIVGSPLYGRYQRFDTVRISDIKQIQTEIFAFVYDGTQYNADAKPVKALPKTLEEVAAGAMYQKLTLIDPATATPYVYTITGKYTFELCADFSTDRNQEYDIFWNHSAARKCFSFDASKPSNMK
jgi:hypothetical protein